MRRGQPVTRLPLEGIRIADLAAVWAGAYATKTLGDMGAEIVKVESWVHYDVIRSLHNLPADTPNVYNKCAYFNEYNRSKLGLCLDLSSEKGRDAFRRLLKVSDVVIENFRADVMDALGLTYEHLKSIRPDIIMVSMPASGKTGPERNYVGYGTNIEQMAGLVALGGYRNGPPHKSGISYGDPLAGTLAAGIIAIALLHRRRTGQGQFIDISQRENLVGLLGDAVLDWSMNRRIWERTGNRHPSMAPHGCYRCQGEDAWVTIAVADDAEWRRLCQTMDKPELATDPRFATILTRHANQDELDPLIEEWTVQHEATEVTALLQQAGIAAGHVVTALGTLSDPHLAARGYFQRVNHPEAGTYPLTGPTWRLGGEPVPIRRPAPCFGEHNEDILGGLLGYTPAEIEELYEAKVTSKVPVLGLG